MIRLLFDENLSPALVQMLAEEYPGSESVISLKLRSEADVEIWSYAEVNHMIVVSQDNEFASLALASDGLAKAILLKLGNSNTQAFFLLLKNHESLIREFLGKGGNLTQVAVGVD